MFATAFARIVILAVALLPGFSPAAAVELVLFERAGCPWCARWDREVAPVYPRTREGQTAPLRRVDLGAGHKADLALGLPVRFTPTFVVAENGREVGRITGYINDESFWGLLGALLARLADGAEREKNCNGAGCP